MACTCGFSTEFPECNGTHKIVKKVKEQIIKDIEEIGLGEENDQLNALGMKMLILNKIRGNK
jgi:CDGSH-type Zn-finger protein